MTVLSWKLSTPPAQTPDGWLLFADGAVCASLASASPYTGVGSYSVDIATLSGTAMYPRVPMDNNPHLYSVALVWEGVVGPQSPQVSITLPVPKVVTVQQPPVVWPTADTLTAT